MNFQLLKQALIANEKLLRGHPVSLSIANLDIYEQIELINQILKEGRIVCKVKIPTKSTEEITAYFSWEGENCYLSIGHINLPSARKSSTGRTNVSYLGIRAIENFNAREVDKKLEYSDKSLLIYVLSQIPDKDVIVLENGTWNEKVGKPLPDKYDCMDKILNLVQYPKAA